MKTDQITDYTNDLFIKKYQEISLSNLNKTTKISPLVIMQCDFDSSHYAHKLFEKWQINFPKEIQPAVKKRQSEFLAGRIAAQLALNKLGSDKIDIAIGKNRAPIWPKGIIGSITHTSSSAICAVTFKGDLNNKLARAADSKYNILGLDLENSINEKTVNDIKYSVINEREERLLKEKQLNFSDAFTLTFSAKESLFKALHPSVGFYFDFTDAEIIDLSLEKTSFELCLSKNLTSKHPKGATFKGTFHFEANNILTVIAQ